MKTATLDALTSEWKASIAKNDFETCKKKSVALAYYFFSASKIADAEILNKIQDTAENVFDFLKDTNHQSPFNLFSKKICEINSTNQKVVLRISLQKVLKSVETILRISSDERVDPLCFFPDQEEKDFHNLAVNIRRINYLEAFEKEIFAPSNLLVKNVKTHVFTEDLATSTDVIKTSEIKDEEINFGANFFATLELLLFKLYELYPEIIGPQTVNLESVAPDLAEPGLSPLIVTSFEEQLKMGLHWLIMRSGKSDLKIEEFVDFLEKDYFFNKEINPSSEYYFEIKTKICEWILDIEKHINLLLKKDYSIDQEELRMMANENWNDVLTGNL